MFHAPAGSRIAAAVHDALEEAENEETPPVRQLLNKLRRGPM